jgi:hypothetical protein
MRVLLDECIPEGLKEGLPAAFDLVVVVLRARSNSLQSLRPLLPDLMNALALAVPGQVFSLGA